MAFSGNSIQGVGAGASCACQCSVEPMGNNIASLDAEGYSRRSVRCEINPRPDTAPGRTGQGVRAAEVCRMFNKFVEKAYLDKSSEAKRWFEQHALLSNIDALVHEPDQAADIGGLLGRFLKGWQTLAGNASFFPGREALLSDSVALAARIREQETVLRSMQQRTDRLIQADVERANHLIAEIAQLNQRINQRSVLDVNNPGPLLEQRGLKARQLAEIVDIDVIDRGGAHYTVETRSGVTLVHEGAGFPFEFRNPETRNNLKSGLPCPDTANDAGGDTFGIVPESAVYGIPPAAGLVDMTSRTMPDGAGNPCRLTGGAMTAHFEFRDTLVGEYRERIGTFARGLIWETNRIHSQGAGLEKLTDALGDYRVRNADEVLSGARSGLPFGDRLQSGAFSFALYGYTGDPVLGDGQHTRVTVVFDRDTDSLQSLVDKINGATTIAGPASEYMTAGIVDGKLHVRTNVDTNPGNVGGKAYSFSVAKDSSGVMAALGVNTFFKGEGANDIAVREEVAENLNLINAAAVSGGGEGSGGDAITALEMSLLANKEVLFIHPGTGKATKQTLLSYYSAYSTRVGSDTREAGYNAALYGAIAADLGVQQGSSSGVTLDEEMTSLVKFQNSYKAAAKLITAADGMLQTILSLRQ